MATWLGLVTAVTVGHIVGATLRSSWLRRRHERETADELAALRAIWERYQ